MTAAGREPGGDPSDHPADDVRPDHSAHAYEMAPLVAQDGRLNALEFDLPHSRLSHLLRHPVLGLRGPARSPTALELAWHDTPGFDLASRGRSLCRTMTEWRLEAIRPAPHRALAPATPARLVRSAPSLQDLGIEEADALRPIAVFSGREVHAEADVRTINVVSGAMQAGTDGQQHPVCRVRLDGFADAEIAALAEALPLQVPRESLPALAVGLAQGAASTPPARVDVGNGPLATATDTVVSSLASSVLYWSAQAATDLDGADETIHQARVAIRRLRSALRVFAPVLAASASDSLHAGLRECFGRLGTVRDLDVFLSGLGREAAQAVPDGARLKELLRLASTRRTRRHAETRRWMNGPDWRRTAALLASFAALRPWMPAPDQDPPILGRDTAVFARDHLTRALRKVRRGEPPVSFPTEHLHALRRRCKRLRYAAELFAPLFPGKAARRFLRRLAAIQDIMGAVNDAAVATRLADELGRDRAYAAGVVAGLAAAKARAARQELEAAWERLGDAEPFWR